MPRPSIASSRRLARVAAVAAAAAAAAGVAVATSPCVAGGGGGGSSGDHCDSNLGGVDPSSLLQRRVRRHESEQRVRRITLDGPGAPLVQPPVLDTTAGEVTFEVHQLQLCMPPEWPGKKGDESCFYTRAYGTPSIAPSIPGPTLSMKPGTDVKLKLVDMLEDPDPCPNTHNNKGLFCYPNSTNIHVHGLHVSPLNGSDSIWTEIYPGQSWNYHYQLPPNHGAGTFWYHPHRHHATSIQAGGGMAGAIIMEDPPNALPPQIEDIPQLIMLLTLINPLSSNHDELMGVWGVPALESMADGDLWKYSNGKQVNMQQSVLVNGQYKPTLSVESGQWYRFRMIYGAIWGVATGRILDMNGGSCEMQMLAKDGVYLNEMPRKITAAYFASGNRVDIAVRCTCKGKKTCSTAMASINGITSPQVYEDGTNKAFLEEGPSQADEQGQMAGIKQPVLQQILFSIDIQPTSAAEQPDLPSFSTLRPCYLVDLTNVDVPASNQGTLQLMNPTEFEIKWAPGLQAKKPKGSPMIHMTQPEFTQINVGEVYEYWFEGDPKSTATGNWKYGTGLGIHPLHTHVNPYQVIEYTGASEGTDPFYKNGDWQDTLLWSGMTARVKFQTDYFVGHMIVHCHILGHEDQGMMGWFNITGEEGTRWSGAQQVDPTCYNDYSGAGYVLTSAGSSSEKSGTSSETSKSSSSSEKSSSSSKKSKEKSSSSSEKSSKSSEKSSKSSKKSEKKR